MKSLKTYLAGIATGAAVVAIGILIWVLKNGTTIINADGNYIESLEQKVGKIKQRGEGNKQSVEQNQDMPLTRKEKRKARKEAKI